MIKRNIYIGMNQPDHKKDPAGDAEGNEAEWGMNMWGNGFYA
jgi:hypothetical protein